MKKVLILLLTSLSLIVSATDYYVSATGNDAANGLSSSTPWNTIAKVNSTFSTFKPSDRILFKRGDTFYGTLKISSSGVSGNPIIIGAYGTGEKPVITGFTTITTWKDEGKGIYSSVVSCQSAPEMVIINGVQYGMGRWPNGTTWATVDSHSGDLSITDSDLGASIINWTGAEVVQRKSTRNIIDKYVITNHTSHTLTYSGLGRWLPANGWGYFIQNDIKTLDTFGEWYYNKNSSTFYMYFGSTDPNNYIVQASTIDELCTLIYEDNKPKDYIKIDNISFNGSNHDAISGRRNENCIYQNCNISFSGYSAIAGSRSVNLQILNNNINHSNDCAIYFTAYCHNSIVSGNTTNNTGLIPGVGQCSWMSGKSLHLTQSDNLIIENNKVYNSGFSGISFQGVNTIVRNNFVDTYALRKSDCGGVQHGGAGTGSNLSVISNIVLNGVESPGGMPTGSSSWVAGIYFDYNTSEGIQKVKNNVVANVVYWGILISGSQNFEVYDNLVYNSDNCVVLQELQGLGSPPRNIKMVGNIFFAKIINQLPMRLNSTTNDFDKFGTFNNNYYAKPLDNSKPIRPTINWSGTAKSLEEWQKLYNQDLNSKISPITLKDTADIDFYYNATKTDKVFTLVQPMIDVTGKKYVNTVTLAPFTSIILMVDPAPAQPVVPVYSSSVIQNVTPNLLEMTYSVNLASVVPPPSAFIVQVNGANRTVSSVAISGNKVRLTLSSPVAFGNSVTVAYTQPPTFPLQTPSLGLAVSIIAQPVTNNLLDPTVPNDPPVLVVKNVATGYSGFVYEIDASGSYDLNNDVLTYEWTVPGNVPVSSTTGSKIKYLSPVVTSPQVIEFQLRVNDGRAIQSATIPINILPYKPELAAARITSIEASDYQVPDDPDNVIDDNLATKWSVNGDNHWLLFLLAVPFKISYLQLAFLQGQKYESYFDIYTSRDNLIWEPILTKAASCNFSGDIQVFDFPPSKTGTDYAYLKLVGHGTSLNTWNNISEFKIFGLLSENPGSADFENKNIVIYPNPAQDFFNISIEEPTLEPDLIRLIDFSGRVVFEELLIATGIINIPIPNYIKPGVYIVELKSGILTLDAQKLVINKSSEL